ncbi:MAG TPA: hypothetical protein VK881_16795 [bacterium]|nr:hypothetical protein [bacterium]
MPTHIKRRALRACDGTALLVVLIVLLAIAAWSSSFVWLMNQQLTRAGARYRSAAALAVAEAGVHRALSILEGVAPDAPLPGRTWRTEEYAETIRLGSFDGQFTLALVDDSDGAIVVTSAGEVGGVARRLRARVYLASPAQLAALYGGSIVRLEGPPAAVFILPYGGVDYPWVHIASGVGLWLAGADVAMNNPAVPFQAGRGPVDSPLEAQAAAAPPDLEPIRVWLGRGAGVRLDRYSMQLTVDQLRAMGVNIDQIARASNRLPPVPEVDRAFYQSRAAGNTANADTNEAAGKYSGDDDLVRKRDSLYSQREFDLLLNYLNRPNGLEALQGVIYVAGGAILGEGRRLQIGDGALVTEGAIRLAKSSSLEVTHSAATRTLPGLITLDNGDLLVSHGATLRVHGLVYASQEFEAARDAHVIIAGSVLAKSSGFSFSNAGAIVIRYDPAVLGTPGLRVPVDAPVIAWVARWEELP